MVKKIIFSLWICVLVVLGCAPPVPDAGKGELQAENAQPEMVAPQEAPTPAQPQHELVPRQEEPRPSQSPLFTSLAGCQQKEVTFTSLPLPLNTITVVEPQGELTGFVSGHITPGDHIGFQYDPKGPAVPVLALTEGYVVRVERNPGYFGIGVKNYHLYLEYSCTVLGSYVHLTELSPELLQNEELKTLDSFPEENIPRGRNFAYPRIPVKAEQVLGTAEKWGLLGMLTVDTKVTLPGFVHPERYAGEPWKIHAVPAFSFFTPELQKNLRLKNPRQQEPLGGKIDFDLPGKLQGNWFAEGTDYAGDRSQPFCGDYLCPYWNGHLAFVRDFIDPPQLRVSLGKESGLDDQGPYGVKDNEPDPQYVSPRNGIVEFELTKLKDVTAARGFTSHGKALVTENTEQLLGTLLVQMTDDTHLQMEVFPGKKAAEVTGFSGKQEKYRR